MEDPYTLSSINYGAIHSIVNRQVQENDAAPLMEKDIQSLAFEERLSMINCFPEPPARGKSTSHRTFEIDLSSLASTMDHDVHKYSNGVQAASYHQRALLQNSRKQKLSELNSNEECIDRCVLQQGSDRETIDSAFYANLSSVDENLLPLESQRLEEDELATPIFTSSLNHVVEKIVQDMTLGSEIECESSEMNKGMCLQQSVPEGCVWHQSEVGSKELCLEKGPQLDSRKLNSEAIPLVTLLNIQPNDADACMMISEGHSIARETNRKDTSCEFEAKAILNVPKELQSFSQKQNGTSTCSLEQNGEINLSASSISSSGHELLCVEESGLKVHPKKPLHLSKSSQLELSNTYLSTCSCADVLKDTYKLQVPQKDFARGKPEIHTPDHDKPFLAKMDRKKEVSQKKMTKSHNLPLSPVSQSNVSPALKLFRKLRGESHIIAYDVYNPCEVEDIGKRGFSPSNTSRSTARAEIKCKENSKRQNKVNSAPNHQIVEKNEGAICIISKGRKNKPLNCEDWQCLQEAGTSWKNGVRRSSRIRSRPLEFWRGERFLYGRVLNCLSSVIGIKYTSPESATEIRDKTKRFKVESYVDEKYSDAVNFAALY